MKTFENVPTETIHGVNRETEAKVEKIYQFMKTFKNVPTETMHEVNRETEAKVEKIYQFMKTFNNVPSAPIATEDRIGRHYLSLSLLLLMRTTSTSHI